MYYLFICFFLLSSVFSSNYNKINTITKKIHEKIPVTLVTPDIPTQKIKILEFGNDYVIVSASSFLGFKHCFYKAIEFFSSKYKKFYIKVDPYVYKDKNQIIVKFIAYDIEED